MPTFLHVQQSVIAAGAKNFQEHAKAISAAAQAPSTEKKAPKAAKPSEPKAK